MIVLLRWLRVRSGVTIALLFTAALVLQFAPASASPVSDCSGLSALKLPDITSIKAEDVPANSLVPAPPFPGAPPTGAVSVELCRVQITVKPQIKIEIWLPPKKLWNHRLEGVGGGGYAGTISEYALAAAVNGDGVTGHFAAASTDTGHPADGEANGQGSANGAEAGGGFALDTTTRKLNDALIHDFASRSLHEMTAKAKQVIKAYYKEKEQYAYWNGCSTGGRQGLMEAQQFPNDYDGILAGAPANNWDRFIPAELWPQLVEHMDLGHPIATEKLQLVADAATQACGNDDGATDGIITSPLSCHFDPHSLQCDNPGTANKLCLTAAEATVAEKITAGPRGTQGQFLWFGLAPGTSLIALAGPHPFPIPFDHWRLWVKADPDFDWHTLTIKGFQTGFEVSREKFNRVIGTDNPDLSGFKAHGGKLLSYHGWADPLIFPQGTIDYYKRVQAANGGASQVKDFYKLYMVPGLGHCTFGPGPVNFGQASFASTAPDAKHNIFIALQRWVEAGEAPEEIVATSDATAANLMKNTVHTRPFSRPLCPFPTRARFSGSGDSDNAKNFLCVNDPSL